jgi:hypothetical protein
MYKALIEMSSDRADFLARLFSRDWIAPASPELEADSLFSLLAALPRDSSLFQSNLTAMFDQLTRHHRFILDPMDSASLQYVYQAFFDAGTSLTYSSNSARGFGSRGMPSYRMLRRRPTRITQSSTGSEETFDPEGHAGAT